MATGNRHKVGEIRAMLADLPVTIRSMAEFPGAPEAVEDGRTYRENALKKAWTAVKFTGKPALADDTGLEVDALGGRPGLYSARFAGEGCTFADNIKKLLRLLKGVPSQRRGARFVCVVALVDPSGREQVVEGKLYGRIAEAPAGCGGFGYDPVFYVPEVGKTLAELTPEEKNRISHRGRALVKARALMREE
ncbi:MAG TPA: XTP/dITP diphosphatase [Nitrospirales bacterium]|nr:XTP/dITP diphosphatase [Nitrospirales bacterium]